MAFGFGADELFGADRRRARAAPGRQRQQPGADAQGGGDADPRRRPDRVRAAGRRRPAGGARVTASPGFETRSARASRCRSADGVALFQHPNLLEVGALANEVRERLHGDRTYFNRNLHINATNVCEASCMFCSFARLQPGDKGAYTMTHDEAWGKLRARVAAGDPITEIHIVNGLHPGLPFDYYTELLAGLKRIQPVDPPQGVHGGRALLLRQEVRRCRSPTCWRRCARPASIRCPAAAPRSSRRACARRSATTSARATSGWTSTAPRTGSACARTARCCTGRSRPSRSASITCCGCARCRTRPAASRRSSRWPSTPTTTR